MSEVEYNALIYKISEEIDETKLEFLKFLCRDHLGNGPSGHITTVRELLLELEKKNRLGIDRLDLLKAIVKELNNQRRTRPILKKVDDFEVRRKAQSIGVISRLNRAADSLVGVVKLVCTWKTLGGVLLGSCGVLALSKCSTLTEVFEVFDKVVLPTGVKLMGISEGSLCFTVQAEMASALNELWNLYKDGTLKNCLQEFLVTKEVKELAGSDEVEVTVFIDEHEWKEAYVNMLFHQNQADIVKEEQVGERRRRNSDSFLFLKSKESDMTKMKLEQSENKGNFQRQLFQQEVKELQMLTKQTEEGADIVKEEQVGERRRRNSDSFLFLKSKESDMTKMKLEQSENKGNFQRQLFQQEVKELQMLTKQTEEGDEVAPELSSQLEQGLNLRNSKTTGKEVVTEPLYQAKPSSKISSLYDMPPETGPELSAPDLRRRKIERARTFLEVMYPSSSISSEVDPFRTDPISESSLYDMPPETGPELSAPDLRRRKIERARRFREVMYPSSSISSEVDPFRTDPISESSLYDMPPEIGPELSVPDLRRRKIERARRFREVMYPSPSISSEVDPFRTDPIDESWYFGNIDQRSAERILKDQNPGRFLVREDSLDLDRYIISWRDPDGYRHQEIDMLPNGMCVLKGMENLRFSSLEASVLHFITGSTNDMDMVPLSKEKGKIPPYEQFRATSKYTPYPRLHLSVGTGDTREIEKLLSSGVDIDSRDMDGRTPLMLAAESGRENTFRLLIERGSNPSLKDRRGQSVLHYAAHGGSNEIIQELLSRGSDIDSRGKDGCTPLMEAVKFGKESAVRLLIERGSDLTSRDNMRQSMLHLAAQNGRNGIIQELLSRGLDIDSRDRDGDTPVIKAAIWGDDDAITLLLERGSDPKQKDAKGRGLLHWAAHFGKDTLIENLLSLGLDINSRENYGDTPLMKAAYRSRENAFSLLIERGADPALTDNRGQSALHWAARGGSKIIIEKLLSLRLDINSKTSSGETPLMLATEFCQAEAVNYLLSRGAK
ncbi:uncharacterized protein [Montipora foliosa]|uniref:uncharacterized protein n=1 Tax=Montipora foliosa TaxID=591990 RepID=UPI0035F12DA1